MQVSAEIRWFWRGVPPPNLEEWFRNATKNTYAAGGGETRLDEYLCDKKQGELSLKRRGGKAGVEVKGLVAAQYGNLAATPFVGPIELWTKWTSEVFELSSALTVPIEKIRWLRKFDTGRQSPEEIPVDSQEKPLGGRAFPAFGCNVEFTAITLRNSEIWWTLGFEAFGTIQTVDKALTATAKALAVRRPPELASGILASYPAWLKDYVGSTDNVSVNR
jgi:hypothetical protein